MHVIAETDISWGLVSLVLLDILFLFSLDVVRRKMRNLFILTHVVASILFLVTVCYILPPVLAPIMTGSPCPVAGLPPYERCSALRDRRCGVLRSRSGPAHAQVPHLYRDAHLSPGAAHDASPHPEAEQRLARRPARPPADPLVWDGALRVGGGASVHDRIRQRRDGPRGDRVVVQEDWDMDAEVVRPCRGEQEGCARRQ